MKTAEQIGVELAFPLTEHNGDGSYYADHAGMTMRQYYKAAALHLADSAGRGWRPEALADWCGAVADAMLAEDEEHAKRVKP